MWKLKHYHTNKQININKRARALHKYANYKATRDGTASYKSMRLIYLSEERITISEMKRTATYWDRRILFGFVCQKRVPSKAVLHPIYCSEVCVETETLFSWERRCEGDEAARPVLSRKLGICYQGACCYRHFKHFTTTPTIQYLRYKENEYISAVKTSFYSIYRPRHSSTKDKNGIKTKRGFAIKWNIFFLKK